MVVDDVPFLFLEEKYQYCPCGTVFDMVKNRHMGLIEDKLEQDEVNGQYVQGVS
jgi:hypothetical protein